MKDKILIYQDYTIHNFGLAKLLKEKHDCELFAIFDVTDNMNKFFQKQKIIQYTKTWFLYDHISKNHKPDLDYLSQFEKKYGIELWKLSSNDRIFYNYNAFYKFSENEVLSILEQQCKLFENILETTKPDFVIFPMTNSGRMEIFYEMCLKLGIKILMINATRLGGRITICEVAEKIDYIEKETYANLKHRSIQDLRNILYSTDSFKDATRYTSQFLKSKKMAFKAGIKYLLSDNSNMKTHYTYYGRSKIKVLFYTLIMSLKKRYRLYLINKNLSKIINDDEKFIFFPLITEPERGLNIAAPFNTNLIELVTHITKSLPIGYKLYVKDHTSMDVRDWRSFQYYKKIMRLPNVKLLHHSVHPQEILSKCSMVITVGGTAGFEAAFYEKPTITFVDALYSPLKSVSILKDIAELPQLIKKQLDSKFDVDDLNNFVYALEKNSFHCDLSGLITLQHNILFYGGFFSDVEITENQMNELLKHSLSELETLTDEHIKKIKQHREYED